MNGGEIAGRSITGRIDSLDGLRGLAIALVMVAHLPKRLFVSVHHALPQVMNIMGYLGVDLFFVLSGFLITRVLLGERAGGHGVGRFYARRAFRIFPIYYLVILLCLVWRPEPAAWWSAAYLSNFYYCFSEYAGHLRHTWSLCVEEHFYLLWPLAVMRLPLPRVRLVVGLLLLLSLGSSSVFALAHVRGASGLIYQGTLSRMWPLCLGASVALRNEGQISLRNQLGATFVGLGLCLVALRLRAPLAFVPTVTGYSLLSFALLLFALRHRTSAFGSPFRWRPLRWLGTISYGLYLFHPFAYEAADALSNNHYLSSALGVAAALAVASASWRFIEAPVLRFRERVTVARIPAALGRGGLH